MNSSTSFLPDRFRPSPQRRPSPRRVLVLALLPLLLALVPLWRVKAVVVNPDAPLPPAAYSSLEALVGTPIVLLDLGWVRDLVNRWPAVHHVDVSMDPSGSTIRVVAEMDQPAASMRHGAGWQAIDKDGRPSQRLSEAHAPLLEGFPAVAGDLRRALKVAQRLSESSGCQVEQVRRITPTDLSVALVFDGSGALQTKQRIEVHVHPDGSLGEQAWAEFVRSGSAPTWADARSDHRVVVRGWS